MATALPTDVEYGYVADRLLRAVLDTPDDEDNLPDGIPAKGKVTLTPLQKVMRVGGGRTTVIWDSYEFKVHQGPAEETPGSPKTVENKGLLVNPRTGHTGAHAVIAGWYSVSYAVDGQVQTIPALYIGPDRTAQDPLWIGEHAELVPTPTEKFVVNEFVYTETKRLHDEVVALIESFDPGTPGGGGGEPVDPQDIADAVAAYFVDNPIPNPEIPEDLITLSDLNDALAPYSLSDDVADALAQRADLHHGHTEYVTHEDVADLPRMVVYPDETRPAGGRIIWVGHSSLPAEAATGDLWLEPAL